MSALPMTSLVADPQPDASFIAAQLVQKAKAHIKGDLTGKDISDLIEFEVNSHIASNPELYNPCVGLSEAVKTVGRLQALVERLPTQSRRDEESEKFQQFSTPPHYAYVAAWVANLSENDVLLEPSAGLGGLAVFGFNRVRSIYMNELSVRRSAMLRKLAMDGVCGEYDVFNENAEYIDSTLPEYVKPTVVVMNPPYSQSAGRLGNKMVTSTGATHVEQALLRLENGGRLVCILGRGMELGKAAFSDWWKDIRSKYTLRANIGIDGREYRKYGTSFGSRLVVLDKVGPTTANPLSLDAINWPQCLGLLSQVRAMRGVVPNHEPGLFGESHASNILEVDGRSSVEKGSDSDAAFGGTTGPGVQENQPQRVSRLPRRRTSQSNSQGPSKCVVKDKNAHTSAQVVAPIEIEVIDTPPSTGELTDAIFEPYKPQRLRIPGSQPHPTPLVQSAAMASVVPPEPTYRPRIPRHLIESGALSDAQLEAVVYAGQAFEQWLEPVLVGGEKVSYRRGYYVGDATGTGKTRVSCAIIRDCFYGGETKAIWMSANMKLVHDCLRDWTDLGGDKSDFIELRKFTASATIPNRGGILFVTYGLLRSGSQFDRPPKFPKVTAQSFPGLEDYGYYGQNRILQLVNKPSEKSWRNCWDTWVPGKNKRLSGIIAELDPSREYGLYSEPPEKSLIWQAVGLPLPKAPEKKGGRSRMDQILEWVGPDFSGPVIWDEAHRGKNSLGGEDA